MVSRSSFVLNNVEAYLVIETMARNWRIHEIYDLMHETFAVEARSRNGANGPTIDNLSTLHLKLGEISYFKLTETPSFTSEAADFTTSGVRRFNVPYTSFLPF
jgi:hypothetical protein